jgi:hypothetical protein
MGLTRFHSHQFRIIINKNIIRVFATITFLREKYDI